MQSRMPPRPPPRSRSSHRSTATRLLGAAVVFALSKPALGLADPTSDDQRRAALLFEEARQRMAEGHYEEACPRFAESNRLDPEVGTQMNLARCYEIAGRTASAWSTWRAAAYAAGAKKLLTNDEAERKRQADREVYARSRIDFLSDHLLYVTLRVPATDGAAIDVRLDGEVVPPERWGVQTPIDPGVHGVAAQAPGRRLWSAQFEVAEVSAPTVTMTVPVLAAAAPSSADVVPTAPPDHGDTTASGMRAGAIAAAAAAVVGAGVGAGFGWAAIDAHSRAEADCCLDARGRSDLSQLHRDAIVSDVAFSAAIAGVGAAALLWFMAPSRKGQWAVSAFGAPGAVAFTVGDTW
jgi:hypothetical protein